MLSTITLFKQDFTSTTYTDAQITNALTLATDILENYCNRDFETQEYIEFIKACGDQFLIVPNYPLTKISDISPDLYDGIKITAGDSIYAVNYTSDDTSITFTVISNDGTEVVETLLYADYYTMSELVVAINLIANITATLPSNYNNEPSKKLKQDNGMIVAGQTDWLQFYKIDLQMKWSLDNDTNDVVKVNRELYNSVYVRYTAGYTYPDDTVTPEVSGNVPRDLSNICNKLAFTLLGEGEEGIKNSLYKSEKLGDYSYTKGDSEESNIVKLMLDDDKILSRYIRKTLTF